MQPRRNPEAVRLNDELENVKLLLDILATYAGANPQKIQANILGRGDDVKYLFDLINQYILSPSSDNYLKLHASIRDYVEVMQTPFFGGGLPKQVRQELNNWRINFIETIPDDVMTHILSFFTQKEVCGMARTSRFFKHNADRSLKLNYLRKAHRNNDLSYLNIINTHPYANTVYFAVAAPFMMESTYKKIDYAEVRMDKYISISHVDMYNKFMQEKIMVPGDTSLLPLFTSAKAAKQHAACIQKSVPFSFENKYVYPVYLVSVPATADIVMRENNLAAVNLDQVFVHWGEIYGEKNRYKRHFFNMPAQPQQVLNKV